ncbi:hypothetical protein G7Y89_g6136 [Cudoniella acicularis]|uniref:laccase n=1 Tax=Cudoniella acicularis TaxID=354080 RepID=A0A8H4W521_9HELO|nr:hypothetical protein G7Y89_g6136 [Cudoniella acicularis]
MLFSKYSLLLAFSLGASTGVIVENAPRAVQKVTSSSVKSSLLSSTKTSSTAVFSPSASSGSTSSSSSGSSKTSSSSPSSTSLVADSQCTNGPFTRQCWGGGFSIATDYDTAWPVTGNTVSYHLEITNTTMAPDGYERLVMAINGQYPGPTIYANWGDTVSVTVQNSLQHNGTGIHWHGIRQMNSNIMDGTSGVTECPIPPGSSRTYTWLATQFGTSWYHSHYSSQYGDGIVGSIVISGPATSNYDYDLGAFPINDWYYQTAFQVNENSQTANAPPTADNGLINGTMVSSYGGAYNKATLQKGKKYRLRLINTSLDNHFRVSLDNHNLTVVQADFVPTKPYTASSIFIAIGERYDVIINANQNVDNYWFRAEVMTGCGDNANNGNIKSIFSYSGAGTGDPTSTAFDIPSNCNDETELIPYVVKNVPSANFQSQFETLDLVFNFGPSVASNEENVLRWNINGSMIDVDWEVPTLKYVQDGNSTYPTDLNLIQLPQANALHFWIIQSVSGIAFAPHPIHLHGHDFYLMGSGDGDFSDPSVLQYNNPPRRDVAMLPSGGWLVLAFETSNPGAWLMHCHIAWHVSQGLAVQFLERASEIPSTFSLDSIPGECDAWDSWRDSAMEYGEGDFEGFPPKGRPLRRQRTILQTAIENGNLGETVVRVPLGHPLAGVGDSALTIGDRGGIQAGLFPEVGSESEDERTDTPTTAHSEPDIDGGKLAKKARYRLTLPKPSSTNELRKEKSAPTCMNRQGDLAMPGDNTACHDIEPADEDTQIPMSDMHSEGSYASEIYIPGSEDDEHPKGRTMGALYSLDVMAARFKQQARKANVARCVPSAQATSNYGCLYP